METKIVLQNDLLWNRLQGFSLDKANVNFPFSKKLAKEENWSEDFTAKAIEEYKKFVYLCCILPNGASPSEIVDKVWHMHLIYTQNYWEEFCPNILQQKLHHHPSNGGQNENEKHKNWFSETLTNYEKIFQEIPPHEVWLTKKEQPRRKKFWLNSFKILSILSVFFILSSCSDGIDNLLTVISIAGPFIFVIIFLMSKIFGEDNNKDRHKNDNGSSGSCGGSSSSCNSSSCGSSCGGGCGGCGGGD
ncbi:MULTISPECIES: hypothetical protein [unclassified Chryseobacterium]|uniref:glycine-rich domain-containing protein n=1 Tax=unclassified Chryseobacterium TaxID=2593645 RepID=UPI002269C7C3|nr:MULTISPECIES: hypothetical protein [unclassified Chryseobacterium]